MKKKLLISLTMIFTLLFAFCACGKTQKENDKKEDKKDTTQEVTEATTQEPPKEDSESMKKFLEVFQLDGEDSAFWWKDITDVIEYHMQNGKYKCVDMCVDPKTGELIDFTFGKDFVESAKTRFTKDTKEDEWVKFKYENESDSMWDGYYANTIYRSILESDYYTIKDFKLENYKDYDSLANIDDNPIKFYQATDCEAGAICKMLSDFLEIIFTKDTSDESMTEFLSLYGYDKLDKKCDEYEFGYNSTDVLSGNEVYRFGVDRIMFNEARDEAIAYFHFEFKNDKGEKQTSYYTFDGEVGEHGNAYLFKKRKNGKWAIVDLDTVKNLK